MPVGLVELIRIKNCHACSLNRTVCKFVTFIWLPKNQLLLCCPSANQISVVTHVGYIGNTSAFLVYIRLRKQFGCTAD